MTDDLIKRLRALSDYPNESAPGTVLEAADLIEQQAARIAELEAFVLDVSKQTPEKPDYWSECGQCDRNIDRAEDLMEASK
ncbi:hypothetical protein [Paraburkholderia atlantica]|uniref:hypothetical protein n=1 Tax=Paraburkholderia atlantica TaxID=2654982 RepID=UPI00161F26FF|nr:hypothetical protein [Paraburkholderia atlantica]MBB5414045.1 hypothetical protein [Paraburkholderia atlantica]